MSCGIADINKRAQVLLGSNGQRKYVKMNKNRRKITSETRIFESLQAFGRIL